MVRDMTNPEYLPADPERLAQWAAEDAENAEYMAQAIENEAGK